VNQILGDDGSIDLRACCDAPVCVNQEVRITADGQGIATAVFSLMVSVAEPKRVPARGTDTVPGEIDPYASVYMSSPVEVITLVPDDPVQRIPIRITRDRYFHGVTLRVHGLPPGVCFSPAHPYPFNYEPVEMRACCNAPAAERQKVTVEPVAPGIDKRNLNQVSFFVRVTPPARPEPLTATGTGDTWFFFALLSHGLIVCGLIAKLVMMFYVVFRADTAAEKMLRATSVTAGMLVFFGAKALGVSVSEFVIRAVVVYSPAMFAVTAIAVPGTIGVLMAWYWLHVLKRGSPNIAQRMMILLGVFTTLQFGDVYLAAVRHAGVAVDKALAPNILFTASMSLYLIFRYEPEQVGPQTKGGAITSSAGRL
jgi:hypothetical protein